MYFICKYLEIWSLASLYERNIYRNGNTDFLCVNCVCALKKCSLLTEKSFALWENSGFIFHNICSKKYLVFSNTSKWKLFQHNTEMVSFFCPRTTVLSSFCNSVQKDAGTFPQQHSSTIHKTITKCHLTHLKPAWWAQTNCSWTSRTISTVG